MNVQWSRLLKQTKTLCLALFLPKESSMHDWVLCEQKKKKKSYMLQQNWVFKSETAMTVAPKNSSYWMNMHQDYTLKYSLHMNNSIISYWPRELLPRWLKGLRGIKHSLRPLAVSLTKLETFGMLPDENEESGGINKGPQTWGRYHMQV